MLLLLEAVSVSYSICYAYMVVLERGRVSLLLEDEFEGSASLSRILVICQQIKRVARSTCAVLFS